MKKKIVYIFIGLFIAGLSFLCGKYYNELDINNLEESRESYKYTYTLVKPFEMKYDYTVDFFGSVEVGDYYWEDFSIDITKDKGELKFNQGDKFSKGDIIWKSSDKVIRADFNGIIDRITNKDDSLEIRVLNKDVLYISVYAPCDVVQDIKYDTEVYIEDENGEKCDCKINYIGNEIVDDSTYMEIKVENADVKPGEQKKVYFVLNRDMDGIFLPEDAVNIKENNVATVFKKNEDGNYEECDVSIGKVVENYEDGNIIIAYQIESGVSLDEDIYIEYIKSNVEDNTKDLLND